MAVGAINSYDGKCPHGTEGYPPHNEIVGKVGCKDGRVWAVCGAHVKEYQRFPETFEIELYPIKELTMADIHYHPCPTCQQAIECSLAIGDEGCKGVKCVACSAPKPAPNLKKHSLAGHLLQRTWVCVSGCSQMDEKDTHCLVCGAAQPVQIGTCQCGWPISEYYPDKCYQGHNQTKAESVKDSIDGTRLEEEAEDKVYECPCGEEHDDPDDIRTCEGPDCQEKICSECCLACQKCSKDICEDCGFTCNDCHESYCEGCGKRCQCCEVSLCESCSGDHGIPKED